MSVITTPLHCGHQSKPLGTFDTGSAIISRNGRDARICYDCADASQLIDIATSEVFVGYLSEIEYFPLERSGFQPFNTASITSWTGGELMTVTSAYVCARGWNGSDIWSVNAVDASGARWYGRNSGPGMCIRMRRSKATPIATPATPNN